MRFENSYSQNACAGCCPECPRATLLHCAHCPQFRCPQFRKSVAARVPDGYDYSHLVGDPAKQHDKEVDPAQFDGLLTDYDRILLRFGMRILWQL